MKSRNRNNISNRAAPTKNVYPPTNPESVLIFAAAVGSDPGLSKPKFHNSKHVSLEKSASTAPARVPVAIKGDLGPGDQAKDAVRGISRRRTILADMAEKKGGRLENL